MPIYALGELTPDIHPDAYVHPDAVVIGNVVLGAGVSVWPGAVLRGDSGQIVVGARTSIQDGTVVHCTVIEDTVIGERCVVGHVVHLEGCIIGAGCLIGSGSIVLNRATVGEDSVVGANAVVPFDMVVPPRSRALGVPATVTEGIAKPANFDGTVDYYVARGAQYKATLRRLD